MARPKKDNHCGQKTAKTRLQKSKMGSNSNQDNSKLKKVLSLVQCGQIMRETAKISKVPN